MTIATYNRTGGRSTMTGPVETRLIDAGEFDSLADLRVEYSRRVGELKAAREECATLVSEKRRAQDILAAYWQEIVNLRIRLNNETTGRLRAEQATMQAEGRAILAEQNVANERARWEALPSQLANALTIWGEHSEDCDHGCVAVIELTKEQCEQTLLRSVAGMGGTFAASALLAEAMGNRDEVILRVIGDELVRAATDDTPMVWTACGCATTDCEPCTDHETCNAPGVACVECLRDEHHGGKADAEYAAHKEGDR